MAFSPNNFPAAIAEIKRLATEIKQLRQQLAKTKTPDGELATNDMDRPKNQDKGNKS